PSDLSRPRAPSTASIHTAPGLAARPSPTAMVASAAVRAPDRQVMGPPGRAPWWYRGPPRHSVRLASAMPDETACGDPTHRPPSVRHLPAPPVEPLQASSVPLVLPPLRRGVARRTPLRISCPVLGQGQAAVEQGMVVARDVPHEDAHLAVIDFAAVAAPLALH